MVIRIRVRSRVFHKNVIKQKIISSKSTCGIQVDCGESITGNRTLVPCVIVSNKVIGTFVSCHESNLVDVGVPSDQGLQEKGYFALTSDQGSQEKG